jgi:uroporphyrin-III C-methyltransferase / precorrin-2 dehydrogenase / sirohydrochlorin ferrochelatase
MNDEPMYPLFLNLSGRNCMVGGGNVMAEAKVRDLLQAGAKVKVIASEVTDAITTWARTERVQWENSITKPGICAMHS